MGRFAVLPSRPRKSDHRPEYPAGNDKQTPKDSVSKPARLCDGTREPNSRRNAAQTTPFQTSRSPAVVVPMRLVFVSTMAADTQRGIRSHAARSAHAKARIERTALYQEAKRLERQHDDNDDAVAAMGAPPAPPPLTSLANLRTASFSAALAGLPASPSPPASLTSFEQFLIHHYVTQVVRQDMRQCSAAAVEAETHKHLMLTRWVPLVLADRGALAGLCLAACRSLAHHLEGPVAGAPTNGISVADPATASAATATTTMGSDFASVQQEHRQRERQHQERQSSPQQQLYASRAFAYKAACIGSVNAAISARGWRVGDAVIAQVLMLASDEFQLGNLETTRVHVEAVEHMVDKKGGARALGLDGFLAQVVDIFVGDVALFPAAKRAALRFDVRGCDAFLRSLDLRS